jgi:TIR domain-containing protein
MEIRRPLLPTNDPEPSAAGGFDCDVFISYNHADQSLAERLSRRIRRYRPPRSLGPELAKRRLVVFRDTERLTTKGELSDALQERINAARNLLVLCSPGGAASKYVNEEIDGFLTRRGRDGTHIVLAGGDPSNAFPPALKAHFNEPLYVDLRPVSGWWRSRRRFRDESLRLIAALLGVDYANLFREDERRTRRQRFLAVTSVVVLAASLASAWLVQSVPVETWERAQVPTTWKGTPLLPIHDFAVNRANPDVVLFRGFGAEYAAHRPVNPIGVLGEDHSEAWRTEFQRLALQQLQRADAPLPAWQPIATMHFTVTQDLAAVGGSGESEAVRWGEGDLYVHAFVRNPQQTAGYALSLRYVGRNDSGETVRVNVPIAAIPTDDPLDLDPWPAGELIRAGALPTWGFLRGSFVTAWDTKPQPLEFRLVDAIEQFQEGNDGMWIEGVVLAADPAFEFTVNGQRIAPNDQFDFRDWDALPVAEWASPSAAKVNRSGPLRGSLAELEQEVAALLTGKLDLDSELDHQITHVARNTEHGTIEAVTATTRFYDEMTRLYKNRATRYFIRRAGGQWTSPQTLALQPETTIVDVLPLDAAAQRLLLLTDREGFRSSDDAGATWRELNHGEAAFRNAERLSVVVAGAPASIYVMLNRNDVQQPNPLYRHKHRTWFERLRIGLAQQLQK